MVSIEHACYTVEPESIKSIFVHPKPQVTEQETHDFMVAVVEESAIPLIVLTFAAAVEILVISAIKFVKSIKHVL